MNRTDEASRQGMLRPALTEREPPAVGLRRLSADEIIAFIRGDRPLASAATDRSRCRDR
jgi:hypothetical protein